MPDNHPHEVLDVSGLLCPLPVLKARKKLLSLAAGSELVVLSTDPMAQIDVPHFCHEQGYDLLATAVKDNVFEFRIRKP